MRAFEVVDPKARVEISDLLLFIRYLKEALLEFFSSRLSCHFFNEKKADSEAAIMKLTITKEKIIKIKGISSIYFLKI